MRAGLIGLLLALTTTSALAAEAAAHRLLNSVFRQDEGVINELDFGRSRVEISGIQYEVALDALVVERGIKSAFTLLRQDLAVQFTYEEEVGGMERRLIRVLNVVRRDDVLEH